MKAIVSGLRYDTATATKLVELPCAANRGDFAWHDSALYRAPRGRLFLAGSGGARSMWAQPAHGGGLCGGSGIRPVSTEEAREILERAGADESVYTAAGITTEEA